MEGSFFMKKAPRLIALVLAIGLISAMLVSCTKTPSDTNAFKDLAKAKGYTVEDVLNQFTDTPQIKEVFIAYPDGLPFQIEFYVVDSLASSRMFFDNMSNVMEKQKGSIHAGSSVSGKNYAKRTMTSDGKFTMVEYIENTLVYVPQTDSSNKSAIEAFLKELKY